MQSSNSGLARAIPQRFSDPAYGDTIHKVILAQKGLVVQGNMREETVREYETRTPHSETRAHAPGYPVLIVHEP